MATQLTGDYVIRLAEVKVELSAEDTRFGVTLTNSGDRIWKYNISIASELTRNQSVANGRGVVDDSLAAAQRVAAIAGEGYEPGSVERGLFDAMAAGDISGWQQNLSEAARISSALRAVKEGEAAIAEVSASDL
jgi:hypothetical protein